MRPSRPVPDQTSTRLAVVADLTIEVGDARGSTTAHLTSTPDQQDGPAGLVLDVPDPVVLLRCVPGRGLRRELPASLPVDQIVDLPVLLTSRGRNIGRVHVSSAGRVRLRPYWSGVPTVIRTAGSYGAGRIGTRGLLAVIALVAGVLGVRWLRRR